MGSGGGEGTHKGRPYADGDGDRRVGRVPTRGTSTRMATVIGDGEGTHKGRPYADGYGWW